MGLMHEAAEAAFYEVGGQYPYDRISLNPIMVPSLTKAF